MCSGEAGDKGCVLGWGVGERASPGQSGAPGVSGRGFLVETFLTLEALSLAVYICIQGSIGEHLQRPTSFLPVWPESISAPSSEPQWPNLFRKTHHLALISSLIEAMDKMETQTLVKRKQHWWFLKNEQIREYTYHVAQFCYRRFLKTDFSYMLL